MPNSEKSAKPGPLYSTSMKSIENLIEFMLGGIEVIMQYKAFDMHVYRAKKQLRIHSHRLMEVLMQIKQSLFIK